MVNNPDFKLNVWNETDLRQFSANNPEKSQTVENRKQYWADRYAKDPIVRTWVDNPMSIGDGMEQLFQEEEIKQRGEGLDKEYGAMLNQFGGTPQEKLKAYWNLAMSRYLELMPIVKEQSVLNATVATAQDSNPYGSPMDVFDELNNFLLSLFIPGEKGAYTPEQVEFIALTNRLRAVTPMIVSGKLPTEAINRSWWGDMVGRFSTGVAQIGTPLSIPEKTAGILTNEAMAALYETGTNKLLLPKKTDELRAAVQEEGGLWSRKWMINPESLGNLAGNLVGIGAPIALIPLPAGKGGIAVNAGSKAARLLFNEAGQLNFLGRGVNVLQRYVQPHAADGAGDDGRWHTERAAVENHGRLICDNDADAGRSSVCRRRGK